MDLWRSLFPLQNDPTGERSPCHTCGRLFDPVDIYPSNTCEQCHGRQYAFTTLESPMSTKSEIKDAAALALMFYALPRKIRATSTPGGPLSITRSTHYGVTTYKVTDLRSYLSVRVATKRQANWVAQMIDDDHYLAVMAERTAS